MGEKSRRIGLIGGMSWESTAEYYRLLNTGVAARLGGLHSARILLTSVDFAEIEALQSSGNWTEAGQILAREARALESSGAELILLCTNTMHLVAGAIEAAVSVPFLHLADTTAAAVARAGIGRVGLLGTAFTMEQEFYRGRLEEKGLAVIVPGASDRAFVHRVIFEELCRGWIREQSRERFEEVVRSLADDGAEGVILGCTEIELLLDPDDSASPVSLFPTTRIHVEAAIESALAR